MTRRKNIVLLFSDQQRADSLPCYGNSFVEAPYLDAMAETGAVFTQCRTVFPVCTPARASMWTGLYPHKHGITRNVYGVPDLLADSGLGDETIFAKLKSAGYSLGYWGKWHLGDANPGGFDVFDVFNSLGGHWLDSKQAFQGGTYIPDKNTNDMIDWMRGQDQDQPFCAVVSWYPPHDPYSCPLDIIDHYRKLGVPHPGYYGSVTALDRCVGRVMAALEESGKADDTIVIYYSDHGETFRARDGLTSKFVCTEDAVHVPLLIKGSGIPENARCDALVGLQDLMPTMLEIAELEPEPHLQGRSILPLLTGEAENWRDISYIENETHHFMQTCDSPVLPRLEERAICDGKHKLILSSQVIRVFDLKNDPEERTNIAMRAPKTSTLLINRLEREARELEDIFGQELAANWATEFSSQAVKA